MWVFHVEAVYERKHYHTGLYDSKLYDRASEQFQSAGEGDPGGSCRTGQHHAGWEERRRSVFLIHRIHSGSQPLRLLSKPRLSNRFSAHDRNFFAATQSPRCRNLRLTSPAKISLIASALHFELVPSPRG